MSGRALEVYTQLSEKDAMSYDRLNLALLKRYDFTECDTARDFVKLSLKVKKVLFFVILSHFIAA